MAWLDFAKLISGLFIEKWDYAWTDTAYDLQFIISGVILFPQKDPNYSHNYHLSLF